MDLLLWRHAEAEDGPDDMERQLTERGKTQARSMAQWILAHCPKNLRVLSSPALRCRQTAEALKLPFEPIDSLGPGAGTRALLDATGWPASPGAVLVVGHQPTLGMAAARLISGHDTHWTVRKGAIWWIAQQVHGSRPRTVLRAVLPPELVESIHGSTT
ncbi:MAG: histidine phosphatase family protein [Azonexus sp.]|nr:histidine phosphatase family protein [Betaproteobacteria bacterium]MBK8917025.1 histidine phosphatase family protein [Betaproteobacteria bacterium]MBP6037296.1 histidine phosphatase family protein [Azonexus sp.]MBP6907844.1 histidine phosphatase family protein [Azonexus sp.]